MSELKNSSGIGLHDGKDTSLSKRNIDQDSVKITSVSTIDNTSDEDVHLPVTEIHIKSHEWFGDFITRHEVPRKVFHSSIGFITLYLYTQGIYYKNVIKPLVVAFIIIFALDILRLHWRFFNVLYCHVVGPLMRKKEVYTYNGVLWYLLGLIFSFTFFSKDVAVISLCLLSWSDTAASTFGRKYGHLTPKLTKHKSLAGTLAAFITGVTTCYMFYGFFVRTYGNTNVKGTIMWTPETSRLTLHELAWLGGLVAALSEGIGIFNWDDNFTIPVLSSIFLHSVIYLFHK